MTVQDRALSGLLNSLYQKRPDWNLCSLSSFSLLFLSFLRKHIQFSGFSSQTGWGEKKHLHWMSSKNILHQFQHLRKITIWYSNINRRKETFLQRCLSPHTLHISSVGQKFSILLTKPINYKVGKFSRHCVLMNFSISLLSS